ncbi:tRNA-(ms[2]io[6]A)-hydroxylase [Psychrobacter sp. FDAARGOS_221]|uniref:tRNA-(ms[2]io[6]A)-hydroxylase n=1 Tax=Psychrobacter sp. FDAARGOS_221 TaxID=1975705 RepID=UPI000BB54BC2|nr:tRNA-(ms[2]io[6]A)-hydroxylase [Psychrobacter sp. FDAARGOS_221]PNK61803.1 tRNA-(ms[2]io[6]A)-hydroxylase [Psychrobacter sp. FDAARGOS_221]
MPTNDSLINDSSNTVHAPAKTDISHIHQFLGAATPQAWLDAALQDIPTLLQDHANCEKKAAGTAMNLIFRYEFHQDLQLKLAQLIREEMLHYEQVVGIMQERGQAWRHLPASRYAKGMLKHKRTFEPAAMIDVLIIGAFIEARSCERFAALSEVIDDERLAKYYRYLLKSESRHYEDYIALARSLEPKLPKSDSADSDATATAAIDFDQFQQATNGSINSDAQTLDVDQRIAFFREVEAELITSPDSELRFHSGVPA